MAEELAKAKEIINEHRAMLKDFAHRAKKYQNRKALGQQYIDSEMWSMKRGSQATSIPSRKIRAKKSAIKKDPILESPPVKNSS